MLTLPDHPCRPGGVVLVGINPAPDSVAAGHYYQGRLGHRLWGRLERVGLLKRALEAYEDDAFVSAGNGLTDLVKRPTPRASDLTADEIRRGKPALVRKLRDWKPSLLLFAFLPPAVAVLGRRGPPGISLAFEGIPTFRLAPPYATTKEVDSNLRQLAVIISRMRQAELPASIRDAAEAADPHEGRPSD